MKRAKGATLAEIMPATKWLAHTVRGFVSILGSKEGTEIDTSKNAACECTYKDPEIADASLPPNAASNVKPGRRSWFFQVRVSHLMDSAQLLFGRFGHEKRFSR